VSAGEKAAFWLACCVLAGAYGTAAWNLGHIGDEVRTALQTPLPPVR